MWKTNVPYLKVRWHELPRDTSSEQSLLQVISQLQEEISLLRQDARRESAVSSPRTSQARAMRSRWLHHHNNKKRNYHQDRDAIEDALWSSLGGRTDIPRRQVTDLGDVIVPSRALHNHLIAYDRVWNSWVHYAVEYPLFEQQCDDFMDAIQDGLSLRDYDNFWLAVYFSLISVGFLSTPTPYVSSHRLCPKIPVD